MKKKGIIAAVLFAILLTLGVVARFLPGKPSSSASTERPLAGDAADGQPGSENGRVNNPEGAYLSTYGDLPANLKLKPVAGSLKADENGQLILLSSIRSRFEYYLAGSATESMDKAVGRLRENIARSLPQKAAQEAEAILDNYLKYKSAEAALSKGRSGLPQSGGDVEKLRALNDEKKQLRTQYFSEDVADAFFGDEEIFDDFDLKRMELFYDTTLSSKQKMKELQTLESQMSVTLRERKKKERELMKTSETDS